MRGLSTLNKKIKIIQMKKPVKKKERAPLKEDLKIRVLNAKKMLPRSGVTSLFFHYFKDTFNEELVELLTSQK